MSRNRLRRALAKLTLVAALTVATLEAAPSSAAGGFGGPSSCLTGCVRLCDGQYNQCLDFCEILHPAGSTALYDCYWSCSEQNTSCREDCSWRCA